MRSVAGFYVRLGDAVDPDVNAGVHALAGALEADRLSGVTEIVPSYASVYVEYDRLELTGGRARRWAEGVAPRDDNDAGREITLGVRYDGLDLATVAATVGIEVAEVVRRHSAVEYRVYAVGFTPGFPFMGAVDPLIRVPRLEVPRRRVEAHTVAIAGSQTGIYPLASPGGWRQLGTSVEAVYDPHRERPFLLEPGDMVRFEPVEGENVERENGAALEPLELLPREPRHPVLSVHEPGLLDLVVDAGRYGGGRLGLARSGPLDARSAATANRLVGNRADAPLLEINVKGPVLEVVTDCVAAFAGFGVSPVLNGTPAAPYTSLALHVGDRLTFPAQSSGVRGYLAVAGDLESGTFMGSASVDVRGLIGRPLAAGDVLGVARERWARPGFAFEPYYRSPGPRRFMPVGGEGGTATYLRLLAGPQADAAAMRALTTALFRVDHADRMGLQLDRGRPDRTRQDGGRHDGGRHDGARQSPGVPGHGILSEANPLGAVQVTPGGQPLILLHDRGTIGGYTKPAVLHPGDLNAAGQLRTGDRVRFVVG